MTIEQLEKLINAEYLGSIEVYKLTVAVSEYLAYRKCVEKWIKHHVFPPVGIAVIDLQEALNEITKE